MPRQETAAAASGRERGGAQGPAPALSMVAVPRGHRREAQERFMLRLTASLVDHIEQRAARERRSRNNMIEQMLIYADEHMPEAVRS